MKIEEKFKQDGVVQEFEEWLNSCKEDFGFSIEKIIHQYLRGKDPWDKIGKAVVEGFEKEITAYQKKYPALSKKVIKEVLKEYLKAKNKRK